MNDLPASAEKVARALRAAGIEPAIIRMDRSTRTAADAARACGCSPAQIVKSLVFQGRKTGAPVLVLVSGVNTVDLAVAAGQIGEDLRRADADTVRAVTGFAIGGIPPLGHATPMRPWMDRELLQFDQVWAAAGTPDCVFSVDPARLAESTGARMLTVGQSASIL